MNRRKFLISTLLSLNNLSFDREPIKKLSLKDKSFTMIYYLYANFFLGKVHLGQVSVNYNKYTKVLDLGLDDTNPVVDFLLPLLTKENALENFAKKRYFAQLDNKSWKDYKEDFGLSSEILEGSTYYVNDGIIKMFQPAKEDLTAKELSQFKSDKEIHNPLDAFYCILNNELESNFDFIANRKYRKDVSLTRENKNDLIVLRTEFNNPILGGFYKFEASLIGNIPIEGYVYQKKSPQEIHGELESLIVEGKILF